MLSSKRLKIIKIFFVQIIFYYFMKVVLLCFMHTKFKYFNTNSCTNLKKSTLFFRVNLTLMILLLTWGFKFCCLYSHLPSQTSFNYLIFSIYVLIARRKLLNRVLACKFAKPIKNSSYFYKLQYFQKAQVALLFFYT